MKQYKSQLVVLMTTLIMLLASINAVDINTCQNLTTANTYYLVTTDINSTTETCFNINAFNITLDCNKHTITGTGGVIGITSNNPNTTIENCTITSFTTGLYLNNTTNGTIKYTTFYNNTIDLNLENINSTNNFISINLGGTLLDFTSEGANLLITQTNLTPPETLQNASNYISIISTDPTEWVNLNISYNTTNLIESTLSTWNYNGTIWTSLNATQDSTVDKFTLNITSFGTYVILGCPLTRPLYLGGACYAYVSITISNEPPNYVIGDIITLFASLESTSLNATSMHLYYLDANGTTYLNQSLLYSPIRNEWFGTFKLRQHSEFLQVIAFDNTTGNNTAIGYGSFTLTEKPPLSWQDWLLIFAIIIITIILILFLIKWFWNSL